MYLDLPLCSGTVCYDSSDCFEQVVSVGICDREGGEGDNPGKQLDCEVEVSKAEEATVVQCRDEGLCAP